MRAPIRLPAARSAILAIGCGVLWGIVAPRSAAFGAESPPPAGEPDSAADAGASDHWAFQPVREPAVPAVRAAAWVSNPIDAFVLARLEAAGLEPSPRADPRTLVRRLSFSLTGLPPTPERIERFLERSAADGEEAAWTALVESLLVSPHHAEHWARHWLDVARYADTKGYVYGREERFWAHAWTYRDWVVRALAEDLPYDRFLLLQLAADQVADRGAGDLAAMGFLTIGRRFLGVKHDIIDDRIDVLGRGTLGLTLGCARCHDHKYDPIPIADYYSLHGVFDSSIERLVALDDGPPGDPAGDEPSAFRNHFESRRAKLESTLAERRREAADRVRARIADYLAAQTELENYPPAGFDQIFTKDDLLPGFVRRWADFLGTEARRRDPVWIPWLAFAALPEDAFARDAAAVVAAWRPGEVDPLVAAAFAEPPASFDEVVERYAALLAEADARRTAEGDGDGDPAVAGLVRALRGPGAPCEVPAGSIVDTEPFFDTDTLNELWKLQGEVERAIIGAEDPVAFARVLVDRPVPVTPRIFDRGRSDLPGNEVPRRLPALLAGPDREPFRQGSGRLELARAIVDPANPLTARVLVNRVWMHHFGHGLVATPSDFGTRAEPPTHPALLDWLASRFVAEGWSLRWLHRTIVGSSTFRQTSSGPAGDAERDRHQAADPANRLLWRMNPHRLGYEEFRDAMMAASGDLDPAVGGRPVDLFARPFPRRRALYGLVDRQFLPAALRTFDFANPDLHIPRRNETTVPQQALFFMNHPLVLERARAVAAATAEDANAEASERVHALFRRVLQRAPSDREIDESLAFVAAADAIAPVAPPATAADWSYGFGSIEGTAEDARVAFTPLPHFTGEAWQGGPNWPDPALGWVQLTALGGHPGNDSAHAAVRRWTAPRAMRVAVRGTLTHEPAAGDGVRASVVSSTRGLVHTVEVHADTIEFELGTRAIEAGETLDFVVDLREVLDSDQFLGTLTITEEGVEGGTTWDSAPDFPTDPVTPLTGWEQLAQTLLCSNEFLFVD